MNTEAPVVLISGCSTGIGRSLTVEFASRNWRVFATARKLADIDDLKAPNVETAPLDVTKEESIKSCVDSVIAKSGRIDMLINNAGFLLTGPLIELETGVLRNQFETNVIGLSALTRAVAPHMIKRRFGKIVNMSSILGELPIPFAGAYCATKAALKAFSDSLRMELAPFGIKVITVQPGDIITNLSYNADKDLERFNNTHYAPVQHFIIARDHVSKKNATPVEDFSKMLVNIILREKTPHIIRLGKGSILLPFIAVLPRALTDILLSMKFGLNKLKDSK